jgi:predicted nucleic acid-binding Zn ribbon protein
MSSKKVDLALELFRNYKTGFVKKVKKDPVERSSTPGDPTLISDVLTNLVADRQWESGLAEGNLFAQWEKIVGSDIATHTTPISILDGVLLIQCSSTAWATQLQAVHDQLVTTISSSAPGALVESLRFTGPTGPSWKKGIRTIRGARGPRDTYG